MKHHYFMKTQGNSVPTLPQEIAGLIRALWWFIPLSKPTISVRWARGGAVKRPHFWDDEKKKSRNQSNRCYMPIGSTYCMVYLPTNLPYISTILMQANIPFFPWIRHGMVTEQLNNRKSTPVHKKKSSWENHHFCWQIWSGWCETPRPVVSSIHIVVHSFSFYYSNLY